jgi:hypothetical protein
MPAVTFQCGNCKNLLAVEDRFLGQQVRCPHCQQVLMAPSSGALPPESRSPEPGISQAPAPAELATIRDDISSSSSISDPPIHEGESIFAPPDHGSEDLFGAPVANSVVELPAEPAASHPLTERLPVGSPQILSSQDIVPDPGERLPAETNSPPSVSPGTAEGFSPSSDWPVLDSSGPVSEIPHETGRPDLTRQAARRAKRESLFTTYLIIILIPYAIFATCVAAYFYWRMMAMPHPMEYLRDTGENPPAKRGSGSVQEIISPETNLPPRLQVALGGQLRVGDLEVQPQKVERRKITICSENSRVSPSVTPNDALVLTLRLRNVSSDVFFTPTDPIFDRQWKGEFGSNRPYTLLEFGSNRYFGGPIKWRPRSNHGQFRADDPREYVKGQEHDNQILKPGEERISILCTDPANREILRALKSHQGPIIWRVHLRRGLVLVSDREVSATAVIGVVFDKKDIVNGS